MASSPWPRGARIAAMLTFDFDAESVFGIWRDEFLGAYEWGGLFNLTCHPQVIGHPSRLLCLRQLVRFINGHDGVWWATGRQVAEHWFGRERDATR